MILKSALVHLNTIKKKTFNIGTLTSVLSKTNVKEKAVA